MAKASGTPLGLIQFIRYLKGYRQERQYHQLGDPLPV